VACTCHSLATVSGSSWPGEVLPGPGRRRDQAKALGREGRGSVEVAEFGGGLGGEGKAPGLRPGIATQFSRAFIPGQGAAIAATVASRGGHAFEFGGDLLIRAGGGRGLLPGSPVSLAGGIKRPGQRLVGCSPQCQRGGVVDRGADQRVTEGQRAGGHLDQARRPSLVEVGE
jgi:hypothetical protein